MKLSTTGLKANDVALDLNKLNLVIGRHGSGKTSQAVALRVLLLGYEPELGKRPLDTAALMVDGKLDVSLTLDDGRQLERSFRRKGSGITRAAECSWLRQATPAEHDAEILALAGRGEPEAIQNLTIKALLDAPPSQKAAVIEAILARGKKTPAEIVLQVARLTVQRITGLDDARMPKDYKLALPSLKDEERKALKDAAGMLEAKLKDSGIPGAITWANEEKREAAKSLDGKTKAKEEIEARLSSTAEVSAEEIGTLEAERSKLEQELGAARQVRIQWLDKTAKRKELEVALIGAGNDLKHRKEAREGQAVVPIETLESESVKLRAKQDKMEPPKPLTDPEIARLEGEARKLHEEATATEIPDAELSATEQIAYNTASAEYKQAEANPWAEVHRLLDDIYGNLPEGFLGINNQLTSLRALAAKYMQKPLSKYKKALDEAKAALAESVKEYNKADKARSKAIAKKDALQLESDQKYDEASKLQQSLAEKNAAVYDAWDHARQEIVRKRLEVDKELASRRKDEESRTKAISEAKGRVSRIEAELQGIGEPGDEPADPAQVEVILSALRAKLDGAQASITRRTEFEAILAEIASAQASRDVYAALEWALQRVREQELNDSASPLLDRITKFLKAAGREERPYLEANRTDCEIGWWDLKKRKVAVQVLSGAEYCLFSTALAAAVISLRKPPLKILIVEGGEVRADQLDPLMRGIKAVSDDLDLALILYPHDLAGTTDPDWNVLKLN